MSPTTTLRGARSSAKYAAMPVPIGIVERHTGFAPDLLAENLIWELESHFEQYLPDDWPNRLARRAEHLFASNEQYRRRISGRHGRTWLLNFYRHWLAGLLAEAHPKLARRLPPQFKLGQPLITP